MASKAEPTPGHTARAQWAVSQERGSMTLLRLMTVLSLRCGRSPSRVLLYFIAAYFCAFAPTARRHSRAYLRRALGREPTALDRFRHVLTFATTIHDRVFLVNERFDLIHIDIEGREVVQSALQAGQGAFLMGSHLGSFEVVGAVGLRQPGLRVAMAMYEENAHKVNRMLAAISPAARPDIIALGQLEAMLKIRERLDAGMFVGVLGDRTLGHEPTVAVEFLGETAHFPTGAMRAAALMRRPVIFMIGLYRGRGRYHVVFAPLADFSAVGAPEREAAVEAAVRRYAALLALYCRSDPYNWFNFYDFWQAEHGSGR